eukprot:CAMPEP_0171509532 /NCGR_PEP_ID=MMETSP0958-20121227/14832_1 /TAXON_ID=87120 /ORGANISM="Aurantiochytrium limacinum, Strain ATCCMYA-1381" /LENGTH=114 /DNA_ID=CAMNT_0012046801 /DNA_START=48 /DNA_END=392 /DNA_ORIENTATION=+
MIVKGLQRKDLLLSTLKICKTASKLRKYYYKKHLTRREAEDAMGGQDVVEALRFLAGYYLKDEIDLPMAEKFCEQLLDYAGRPEKKEAEAMLREIRQLRAARAAATSSAGNTGA